jgi:hypothetical protein
MAIDNQTPATDEMQQDTLTLGDANSENESEELSDQDLQTVAGGNLDLNIEVDFMGPEF